VTLEIELVVYSASEGASHEQLKKRGGDVVEPGREARSTAPTLGGGLAACPLDVVGGGAEAREREVQKPPRSDAGLAQCSSDGKINGTHRRIVWDASR